MRVYCIAQGTLLNALTQTGRKSKKEGIYVHVQGIHFAVQQKQTHRKATIIKIKKQNKNPPKMARASKIPIDQKICSLEGVSKISTCSFSVSLGADCFGAEVML